MSALAAVLGGAVVLAVCWRARPAPARPGSIARSRSTVHRRAGIGGRRSRSAAVAAAVPELVDLFLVATSAGLPVAGALVAVAPRSPPPVAGAVTAAAVRFSRGVPLVEALAMLGDDLGPSGVALVDVLARAATTGADPVPLLRDVGADARDARRRSAQERARRLPVLLLLPLAGCILPAAVVLAVVPVLVVSLQGLQG